VRGEVRAYELTADSVSLDTIKTTKCEGDLCARIESN